jgi:anti-anti-sigma regulatory factor
VLCLAGVVDATAVEGFLRRYGREPARVEGIDVRSVTVLSEAAVDLVLDHLDMAERTGRPVQVRSHSPAVEQLLADHRTG